VPANQQSDEKSFCNACGVWAHAASKLPEVMKKQQSKDR